MTQDAQSIAAEAQRLIDHPLLNKALDSIVERLTEELLSPVPSHIENDDKWRRDHIDSINAVRSVKDVIRTELMVAAADLRARGGVA